ncbi:MAG: polysaccharide biosynthesis C-terminal domain-containing protein [Anaerolineales bacterium]|nr:polysaccharide biosynthesis C-terminal domain-containing protein [Anaerolineales bacterium]
MDNSVIARLSWRFLGLGLVFIPPAMLLAWLIIPILYDFEIPVAFFVIASILILPTYAFLPIIYGLYKIERQVTVLKINFFSAGLTVILTVLLLPTVGLIGALIASAVTRWIALGLYRYQLQHTILESSSFREPALNPDTAG